MVFHNDFPQNSNLHCMTVGSILKESFCTIATVQSVIVVSLIYYINKLYIHIKYIHVQIHIYILMYIYIRTYTYSYTLPTFSAEIVIFERFILPFPEFYKVHLCVLFTISQQQDTIFSHKIHLKLFQKQC